MHSNPYTVIVFLGLTGLEPVLPAGDANYGLKQAEKVVKGICWLEFAKLPSHDDDIENNVNCRNYVDKLRANLDLRIEEAGKTTADDEHRHLTNVVGHLDLGKYYSCISYISTQNEVPDKDYGWLLPIEESKYPYRAFSHCLLEEAENRKGMEGVLSMKYRWDKWDTGANFIEYGIYEFEKAALYACLLETRNNLHCYQLMHMQPTYQYLRSTLSKITPEAEDTILPGMLHDAFVVRITNYLANYTECLPLFKYVDKTPIKNYTWVLGDIGNDYTYKGAAHCLLERLESLYGLEYMSIVKQFFDDKFNKKTENKAVEKVEELAQEVKVEETIEEDKSKFSAEDVEFGLTQAKKVAAGVCWVEKLNKPYPENDGGVSFIDCKKHNDYTQLLQTCRDGSTFSTENENTYKDCLQKGVGDSFKTHLPDYTLCLHYLQDINLDPDKDYGWLLGDSERGEYPYKGYTHCLLQLMEMKNEKQSLDDLKSKWETPKTLVETLLERENEHRSWHTSPPLEIDEELTRRAQSYADHLAAEVCEPTHMLSNNPEKRYNGTKCGENVLGHSDLTLTDDEMAVMAAVGWYKESELYPWPLFNGVMEVWTRNMVGHFTQSVWKETKLVGYAISRETETCKKIFVVARYWPTGNKFWKVGQEERTRAAFEKNVLPRI